VPLGAEVHVRSRGGSVSQSAKGTAVVMEPQLAVVGQERPALVYDLIVMYL